MFTLELIKKVADNTSYFFPFTEDSFSAKCLLDHSITKEQFIEFEKSPDHEHADFEGWEDRLDSDWGVILCQRQKLLNAFFQYSQFTIKGEQNGGIESNAGGAT